MTVPEIRREVRRARWVGDSFHSRHRWSCSIDSAPDALNVRIAAPDGPDAGDDPDPAAAGLHDTLLRRLPRVLHPSARSEAGIVRTRIWAADGTAQTWDSRYALATCGGVVVMLADEWWEPPAVPWRGSCAATDLEPGLPVLLGPSAVLSLVAAVLEMPSSTDGTRDDAVPGRLSARSAYRSPYPPHDFPPQLARTAERSDEVLAATTRWVAHTEGWMRPMWTTRTSRGHYDVTTTLPEMRRGLPALWVESLVSLDTLGRTWQASLSVEREDGRWCLTGQSSVQIAAGDLLGSAVGEVAPPEPALDRDPVDGESFGWAPSLLTGRTVADLGVGRTAR